MKPSFKTQAGLETLFWKHNLCLKHSIETTRFAWKAKLILKPSFQNQNVWPWASFQNHIIKSYPAHTKFETLPLVMSPLWLIPLWGLITICAMTQRSTSNPDFFFFHPSFPSKLSSRVLARANIWPTEDVYSFGVHSLAGERKQGPRARGHQVKFIRALMTIWQTRQDALGETKGRREIRGSVRTEEGEQDRGLQRHRTKIKMYFTCLQSHTPEEAAGEKRQKKDN